MRRGMRKRGTFHKVCVAIAAMVIELSVISQPIQARTYLDQSIERRAEKIETDHLKKWPKGPAIGAEAAVLMDADTGAILYAKNMHEKLYPASVTKVLTGLIAMEECDLKEMVRFSHEAVFSVPWDGAQMGTSEGEKIRMDHCLNGMLVHSANEVANGIAEHISGSVADFGRKMTARAKELGCTDSNFTNPSGLFDTEHYTSAHDLALIASEFIKYDKLCEMSSQHSYTVPKTNKRDAFTVYSKNKFFSGEYPYEPIVFSKTGYTNEARQTLVSGAIKDGKRLVCVILKEESPYQFTDTIDLFKYGFESFDHYEMPVGKRSYQAAAGFNWDGTGTQGILLAPQKVLVTLPKGISKSRLKVRYEQDLVAEDLISKRAVASRLEDTRTATGTFYYMYHKNPVGKGKVICQKIKIPQPENDEKGLLPVDGPARKHWMIAGAIAAAVILILVVTVVLLVRRARRRRW